MATPDYEILSFADAKAWHQWLDKHHAAIPGVWIKFFKKSSGKQSITYAQALDEALCFGWIDSQAKSYDEESYLQKFTPRRSKSIWSQVNTANIERLIKDGRMQPAGLLQVEEAKKDGRWVDAYSSPSQATEPKEFLQALSQNKEAQEFYQTLNKANKYAIIWRLQTAKKPETKQKRIIDIITKLAKKETFH
jgi:uncharacterized protein YdeI (YjbR/CyaY-like superfamily)